MVSTAQLIQILVMGLAVLFLLRSLVKLEKYANKLEGKRPGFSDIFSRILYGVMCFTMPVYVVWLIWIYLGGVRCYKC